MYIQFTQGFWIVTLGAMLFTAAYIVWSLARGAASAGLSAPVRARLIWASAALITAWAALVSTLASRGVFHSSAQAPFPYIAVGILGPLLVGGASLLISPALRAAVWAIPQYRLIGIQGVRVLGVTFLILMAQRQLPPVFALPAGVGDILVGSFAILLAREFYKGNQSVAGAAVVWNVAGVLDLVNAVAIGFLASTTPYRLIFSTPASDAMSVLPMVMIPVFGIPLFLLLHGISLARLRARGVADTKGIKYAI